MMEMTVRKVSSASSSSTSSSSSLDKCDEDDEEKVETRRARICRMLLDLLLFYTTSFFVLLAIFSIFALIFLVPFFIDPAWSTLRADFDPKGTFCRTVRAEFMKGRSSCEWSSCEEGCTKQIYTCWQIEVEYLVRGVSLGPGARRPPTRTGRLFPNVKGCGYPPNVVCEDFVALYGNVTEAVEDDFSRDFDDDASFWAGHTDNDTLFDYYSRRPETFQCYYSRTDPNLVIVDLDLQKVREDLFYSIAIPVPCLIISLVYMVVAYFYIYTDPPERNYRPIATLSTATAMAALIDVGGMANPNMPPPGSTAPAADETPEERTRRLLLLQASRAKLLASHSHVGKSATSSPAAALMIRTAVATTAATTAVNMPSPEQIAEEKQKAAAEKSKGEEQQQIKKLAPKRTKAAIEQEHFQKVQKYRKEYGKEKYDVMQYYQYYGLL